MVDKKREELLAEIYRNAQLALTSIADILPALEEGELKQEILRQHEEYEKISAKASMLAKDQGYTIKPPNPLKKAMMWSSIKMSTLTDDSPSHIAEMMVQGTVMGITAIKSSLSEREPLEEGDEIVALAKEFLALEEDFEGILKGFV